MCLLRSDLQPNHRLHFWLACFLIFSCTLSIWFFKYSFLANPLLHIWQTCCFKLLCAESICLFRWQFLEKLLVQKLHLWGLSFLWTPIMWSLRVFDWPKHLLQIWHWNLVFFSWTVAMCVFKWYLLLRILLHNLHFDITDLAPVINSSVNFFFASVFSFIFFLFLWKYFTWIINAVKLRNLRLHFRQLCNFRLFNDDGSC